MSDNTRSLILTGIFAVLLPVALALLGPVAAAALWVFRSGSLLFWPIFAGMMAGLFLSYLVYRFASPRWLAWALQRASNLPHFKRKAIRSGLIPEKGRALLGSTHFLEPDTLQKLQAIDHRVALHDNPDVPAERVLYSKTRHKHTAALLLLLFLLAGLIILLLLPRSQWSQGLYFLPLLLIGIFFFLKSDSTSRVLTINEQGISLPTGSWSWSQIDTIQYTERRSSTGAPGRAGYFSQSYKYLSFETIDGKKHTLSLHHVDTDFDLEEEISVYRFRHQRQPK